MKGLTKRQSEIINFIEKFISKYKYSPSYREIMAHFRYSSLGSVYKHIQALQRKGVLSFEKQSSRSLTLTAPLTQPQSIDDMQLPFIGNITPDNTIETFSQIQTLAVPAAFVSSPDNTYLLRVRGDNYHQELIGDGDLLIVEARHNASPGDLIIALIDNNKITVKKYYPEGNHVRLKSIVDHAPSQLIKLEDYRPQGVVTGLLRLY